MRQALIALLFASLCIAALAQTAPDAPATTGTGSISGVVRDARTGAPLPEVRMSVRGPDEVVTTTDAAGRYKLASLPPGQRILDAMTQGRPGTWMARAVILQPGQDLTGVDFNIAIDGIVTGRVLDDNKDPVPNVTVVLVGRYYHAGALRHYSHNSTITDQRGAYTLGRLEPDHAWLVLAEKREQQVNLASDAPADPSLRKPAFVPAYYPGSPDIDGAVPLVLRAGERQEAADIRLPKSPSYCIEGLTKAGGVPAPLNVWIEPPEVSANGPGPVSMPPGGKTGPDGRIRMCDLPAGQYKLTAWELPLFGVALVTVKDRDVTGVEIVAQPGFTVSGEVAWDGPAPDVRTAMRVGLCLEPLVRPGLKGEELCASATAIPGAISFPSLSMGDYALDPGRGLPRGLYVKDVTYGGVSVLREPLRIGSALGNAALRVIVARDGGGIEVTVRDRDGKPVADSTVVVMPAGASSDILLAATLVSGATGQDGLFVSGTLPPGKYYVLARRTPIDASPECVGGLRRAQAFAREVDVGANGWVRLSLETP